MLEFIGKDRRGREVVHTSCREAACFCMGAQYIVEYTIKPGREGWSGEDRDCGIALAKKRYPDLWIWVDGLVHMKKPDLDPVYIHILLGLIRGESKYFQLWDMVKNASGGELHRLPSRCGCHDGPLSWLEHNIPIYLLWESAEGVRSECPAFPWGSGLYFCSLDKGQVLDYGEHLFRNERPRLGFPLGNITGVRGNPWEYQVGMMQLFNKFGLPDQTQRTYAHSYRMCSLADFLALYKYVQGKND